jgi:transcriptional regulator with XRE-family HTH domain
LNEQVTTDNASTVELDIAIGRRLRLMRSLGGISQAQLADAAKRHGFPWGQSSVAEIEGGNRPLRAAELLALPFLLNSAVSARGLTYEVDLAELLYPGADYLLAITPEIVLTNDQVGEWLGETLPPIELSGSGATATAGSASLTVTPSAASTAEAPRLADDEEQD